MKKSNLINKGIVLVTVVLLIGISITTTTGYDSLKKSSLKINPSQVIDGFYFLRGVDDLNMNDVGSLLRDPPEGNESTACGMFIVFHFAERGTYVGINRIFNIYYHVWQMAPSSAFQGEIFDLGYSTSGSHNQHMDESVTINTSEYVSLVDNMRLIQVMQLTNPEIAIFEGDEIYNLSVKSYGNGPFIRTNPNQYSFVILNLEDNATLLDYDRDNDYLNDYDELFVSITNPFDNDTDDDGVSDYDECQGGSDPNNYSDWNHRPNIPSNPNPIDGARGVSINPTLSIYVSDPDGDFMNVTFRTNASGSWTDIGSNNTVSDEICYQVPSNMDNYSTTYHWSVNVTDGTAWTNATYSFTTEDPNASIVSVNSCLNHGDLERRLYLDAFDIEPRLPGVTKLEFDLSASVISVNTTAIGVNYGVYDGTITVTPNGSMVTVEFDPALADQDCWTITLSGDVEDSFCVRTLAGDVSRDGQVTVGDKALIKPRIGEPLTEMNFYFDVSCDGEITLGDKALIKPRVGNSVPNCS